MTRSLVKESIIGNLLKSSAQLYSNRIYIQQDDQSLTYNNLLIHSDKIAHALSENKQACIGIHCQNSIEYIICYYGIINSGNIAVPINYDLHEREKSEIIKSCNIETLFIDEKSYEKLKPSLEGINIILTNRSGSANDLKTLDQLLARPHRELNIDISADDLALVLFTSGTNGQPNGVCLSHKNLTSNAFQILNKIDIETSDNMLVILPFYYSYGNSLILSHLIRGARLTLCNNTIFPVFIIRCLESNQCTSIAGVASHFVSLIKRSKFKTLKFEHLRYITFAGESVSNWLLDQIVEMGVDVYKMYGQTEASARISILTPDEIIFKKDSVGKPLENMIIKIVDDNGNILNDGQEGEIICQGDNIMLGYYKNKKLTNQKIKNGFLYTGDYGKIDGDGYLYVNGRKDEMMKVGGNRVFPLEIEKILLELPEVKEAAVVGIKTGNHKQSISDYMGSTIVAFVVIEGNISSKNILEYCKKNLPIYKVPGSIHVVDKLPKTTTGKLRRKNLREQLELK